MTRCTDLRTRHSRLAAAFTAVTAWTVAATGAGVTPPPPPYASLVLGLAGLVGLVAAVEVRRTNRFEARLAAAVVAGMTVVGELVVASLGFPATGGGHWSPEGATAVAFGCGVLVLVALDARERACRTVPEHPYAR
jgi:hypothetical protein